MDYSLLVDPLHKSPYSGHSSSEIAFKNGAIYPMVQGGIPLLIPESKSFFKHQAIINQVETTQKISYNKGWKRTLRNSLPSHILDRNGRKRLERLSNNGRILIIGTGSKEQYYKSIFDQAEVICSDVHLVFGHDIVIDAHYIPFPENHFDLIIACEVLEHTVRPWQVAAEMQRVCKKGGIIHLELPFCFPYHGFPYDFYRYTPGGVQYLFEQCEIIHFDTVGGNGSATSVFLGNLLVSLSSRSSIRSFLLVISRIIFAPIKYLDLIARRKKLKDFIQARGFGITMRYIKIVRTDSELLESIKRLTD